MQIHPIGSSPTMTMVREGHRRRLTPPSNLWLVCEGALARVRAMWGGCPPHPPHRRGKLLFPHAGVRPCTLCSLGE